MKIVKEGTGHPELQTDEYCPRGPVVLKWKLPTRQREIPAAAVPHPIPPGTKLPGSVVYVEPENRVKGHIYDDFSGQCLGLASDEEKAEHRAGVVYTRHKAGMKQKVVIW